VLGTVFVSVALSNLIEFFFRTTKGGLVDPVHGASKKFWTFKGLVFLFFLQKVS